MRFHPHGLLLGLTWSHTPDAFYSVARDGLLLRHHISEASQTVRLANPVALALNCQGPVAHAVGGEAMEAVGLRGVSQRSPVSGAQPASVSLLRSGSDIATFAAMRTPHQLLVTRRSSEFPLSAEFDDSRKIPGYFIGVSPWIRILESRHKYKKLVKPTLP